MIGIHQRTIGLSVVLALILVVGVSPSASAITAVGDGNNPPDITIAPGGSATMLNAFTLQTDVGSDNVTQVSVNISGVSSFLALIEVTSDSGTVVHGSKNNPSGNPVGINITNNITATTILTQYKVRITPASHDEMLPPPGVEYPMFGRVMQIQSSQGKTYDDTNSAIVVIDNLSPSNATWGPITDGDEQILLTWTNPPDADFDEVVLMRNTAPAGDRPEEGTNYVADDTIGSSIVRYVGALESFLDTSVTNLNDYYYRVFGQDSNGNYSVSGPWSRLCTPCELKVGDGTDPGNTVIAPGGPATMLDAFTVRVPAGMATVTAVTVSIETGTSESIGLLEITSDSGSTVHGNVVNPASDTVAVSLTSNIVVTTIETQYKVRITPAIHADMPAPPGSTYTVTGAVVIVTSGKETVYTDIGGTTIDIDNTSPGNASWDAITAGDEQIELNWINPGDSDFDEVVILRRTSAVSDTPVEGVSYAQGNSIGSSTVRYVGSLETFTDTGLTNEQDYYYKSFARDTNGNYSASGLQTGPHIPWGLEVGDGTDPADSEIAPGGAATAMDAFTLKTSMGMDTVTVVRISVPLDIASRLALIEITSDLGGTVYGSVADPETNLIDISLLSNIEVGTTETQYKVRVTPSSHGDMPAPPGATYSVIGIVVQVTSTKTALYSDANSADITIDNLSPGNAAWGTIIPGDGKIQLSWINPGDADLDELVLLRNTALISDVPVEGASYAQGNTIGSSTVRYVGSLGTFTDTELTNDQGYYYRLFAKDIHGNYSASGTQTGPWTPRSADVAADNVRLGVDVSSTVNGTSYGDESAVSIGAAAAGSFFAGLASGIPGRAQLDALMVYSNQIIFSLDVDCIIDSATYRDEDLVAYDANAETFSMFLDGSDAGIPESEDIDAVCFEIDTTNLLMSFDTTTTLPGPLTVDDDDIVRYASGIFTKLYDGQTDLGIPESADVNALYQSGANLYFSLDKTTTLNGAGADEQIWIFDMASSNIVAVLDMGLESRADLVCLDYPRDSDGDWLTDFEESSGIDEAASTYPGTAIALDPGDNTSDPNVTDTDNDGISDGGEAACGTDPDNSDEVLEFVDTTVESGTNIVVIWQSVEGKTYALDDSDNLIAGITNELVASYPATAGTNVTAYTNYDAIIDGVRFYRIRLVP